MKSVGDELRLARLKRGMDVAALASLTRINARYLEAIEAGDTRGLPGDFYLRSFVRQYASALDLPPKQIEDALAACRNADRRGTRTSPRAESFPVKLPDEIVTAGNRRGKPPGHLWAYVVLLFAVMVGCSAFYAWWHRLESAAASMNGAGAAVATAQDSSPLPQPAAAVPASTSTDVPSAATPETGGDHHVVITIAASEPTWVSVNADGKRIFDGVISANESTTLDSKEAAKIQVGNAGGIVVTLNGKDIGPIGPKGQLRTVEFTRDTYRVIAPAGTEPTHRAPSGSRRKPLA